MVYTRIFAWFVKTVDEPVGRGKKLYAVWQESCRKDVERAFGVLQQKFQILKKDVEQWYLGDIKRIVETSIILHNMMVEYRVDRGQRECMNFYEVMDDPLVSSAAVDMDEEYVERRNAEMELHMNLERAYYQGTAINVKGVDNENLSRWFSYHQQVANRRWQVLYDRENHYLLQDTIIQQLIKNDDAFKAMYKNN